MKKRFIVDIIAALFIALFVYAAASKLLDYQKFKVQIGKSPLLTAFTGWIPWFIPTIELIIGLFLVIPRFRLTALYASFGLMVMFTAYIIAILKFSEYIPCSCGGILQNMSWNQHLIFNIGFVLLSIAAIFLEGHDSKNKSPNKELPIVFT